MFRINESSPNFLKPERQHTPEKKQASTRSTIKLDLNQHGNFQNNQDGDQKRWPKSCRGKYRYLDQKINFQSSNTLTFRNYRKKQEDEKQQSQKLQTPSKQQIVKKFNLQQISPASNKSNNSYLKGISNKVQKDLKFRSILSQYMSQKSNKSNCFNNFNNFKPQEQKLQKERQNSKVKQKQYKVLIQPFNLQKHQIQTQKKQITTKRQVSKPEFKLSNFLRTSRKNNEQKINLFKQFQESKRGQKQQNEIKKFKQIEENQTVFQQKQNETKNQIQISPVFEETQKKSSLENQQLKEQLVQKLLKANFQKIIEPLMIQISKLNAKVEELVQQKHKKQIQEKLIKMEKKQINFNNQQIVQSHSHHQENIIFTSNKFNEQQQVQQSQIHISMSSQPDIKISCQKQKYEQFAFLQAKQIRHTDSFRVEANNFQEELNNLQNSATHKSQINYLLDESSEEEFYYQV